MKVILDRTSHVPLYIQIEEQLRNALQLPEYKNGKKIPSEIEISKQLGISRTTFRQAVNKLVNEGLLVRKKGYGTIASNGPFVSKATNWMSFTGEMNALGISVRNYELSVKWVKPSKELTHFFNIDESVKILKLERLRGNQEFPFVYFISYFNPQIGVHESDNFQMPLYELLETKYHTIAKVSKAEISAIKADDILSKKMEVPEGTPILKRKRFVFDPGGKPIEWNVGYYRGDSFVYTIESEKKI